MSCTFRNISAVERTVLPNGVVGPRRIAADAFLTVTDEAAEGYRNQPTIWAEAVADGVNTTTVGGAGCRTGAPVSPPAQALAEPTTAEAEPAEAVTDEVNN